VNPLIHKTTATKRFYGDNDLIDKVAHTFKLSEVNEADFDAVFYPGGHGHYGIFQMI